MRALREQINGLAAESQKRQQGIDALKMKIVLVRPASCDHFGGLAPQHCRTLSLMQELCVMGPGLSRGCMLMLQRVLCCPCCSTRRRRSWMSWAQYLTTQLRSTRSRSSRTSSGTR